MNEPFIAMIGLFGFEFAPNGWAKCQGQIMSIAQNTALFSLVGTTYGGNGQTTFALPDLQGRTVLGQGNGPGLTPRVMGEAAGTENVTLISTQMPMHNHTLNVASQPGSVSDPANHVLAIPNFIEPVNGDSVNVSAYAATPNAIANPQAIGVAGGNQPHPNMQPYLVMNYCIALQGIYPSRS
jgi:microcystin-dependent protein